MKLFLGRSARKEFSKLPPSEKQKVSKKIDMLENEPLIGKKLGGRLSQRRCLRSWPYRIIYFIEDDNREIWVEHIIHRQGAYK